MKKVMAMGELLIDFIPHEKGCPLHAVTHFERAAGGAPANVASAVARLGGNSGMISQVGEDAFGTYIINVLKENGVDTSAVFRTDKANTGLAFVSLDIDGNRDFAFFRNPSADLFLDESQIDSSLFTDCGALHFCSVDLVDRPVRRAHIRAIELARASGAVISFDPNVRLPLWNTPDECREAILMFLPYADIVKLSDDEVFFVTGLNDEKAAAEKLLKGGASLVLITRGAHGCAAYTENTSAQAQAISVPVTDTTGAGDSFIGALLFQLMKDGVTVKELSSLTEQKLREYLTFCSQYASLTVQKKGAVMATMDEVIKNYPRKTL